MSKINMRSTIVAKSDQLNADDLIGSVGKIIRITRVTVKEGIEQPCIIHFEGDGGKPYKPCKSMCRVLIFCWGDDGADYVGRRLKLFRDKNVTWAGQAVGGIRIAEMSDIPNNQTMPLTMAKNSKKPYTVRPLKSEGSPITDADYQSWTTRMDGAVTEGDLLAIRDQIAALAENYDEQSRSKLRAYYAEILNQLKEAVQ